MNHYHHHEIHEPLSRLCFNVGTSRALVISFLKKDDCRVLSISKQGHEEHKLLRITVELLLFLRAEKLDLCRNSDSLYISLVYFVCGVTFITS